VLGSLSPPSPVLVTVNIVRQCIHGLSFVQEAHNEFYEHSTKSNCTAMLFILLLVPCVISSGAPMEQNLLPQHFLSVNLILVSSDNDVTRLLSLFEVPAHAEPAALPSPQQALFQSSLH
jgi:hypothetical protein